MKDGETGERIITCHYGSRSKPNECPNPRTGSHSDGGDGGRISRTGGGAT